MRGATRLRALRELRDARELAEFLYLTTFAATVPLLMRLPLSRVASVVVRPTTDRRPGPETAERLAALVELAHRVARPAVRSGCLTRGVTLFWFLRRAGIDVELRFGLDPTRDGATGAADAHCWLTLDSEPYLERVDPRSRFAEIYRMPPATRAAAS